jgi:hypothetical protein
LELSEDGYKMESSFIGVSSWDKTQTKQVSERLQYLFGNISQLIEKGKLDLDGEESWGPTGVSHVARNVSQVCTATCDCDGANEVEL